MKGGLVLALVLGACAELPWGAGGPEVAPTTRGAIVRRLDAPALTRAERRLGTELTARFGPTLTLRGLSLPRPGGEELAVSPVDLSFGPIALSPGGPGEITARVELSAPAQPVTGAWPGCDTTLRWGAGVLVMKFELSTDRLGRVQPLPRGAVSWEGPPPSLVTSGCERAVAVAPDLGQRLSAAAAAALSEVMVAGLPSALGLDLALSWSQVVGADALGAGVVRASLRASIAHELGLAMSFDLGLEADHHPCAALLRASRPGELEDPGAPGTAIAIAALERTLGLYWAAGATCGASAWALIPERDRAMPLAELDLEGPGLALLAVEPDASVSATFWPRSVPIIEADDERSDALRISVRELEVDVELIMDGARWRLFSVEAEVVVVGQLATDPRGFLFFDPLDVQVAVMSTSPSLGSAPDEDLAQRWVEPIARTLLESRPLARLPASLTPTQTTVWRITATHAILPDEAP